MITLTSILLSSHLFIGALVTDSPEYNKESLLMRIETPILDVGFRVAPDMQYRAINAGININNLFNAGVLISDTDNKIIHRGYISKRIGNIYMEAIRNEQDSETYLSFGVVMELK